MATCSIDHQVNIMTRTQEDKWTNSIWAE